MLRRSIGLKLTLKPARLTLDMLLVLVVLVQFVLAWKYFLRHLLVLSWGSCRLPCRCMTHPKELLTLRWIQSLELSSYFWIRQKLLQPIGYLIDKVPHPLIIPPLEGFLLLKSLAILDLKCFSALTRRTLPQLSLVAQELLMTSFAPNVHRCERWGVRREIYQFGEVAFLRTLI